MTDLAPFWIREMQARIESDWNEMRGDQHRSRMREITATLSSDALHELWGKMKLGEPETAEISTMKLSGLIMYTSHHDDAASLSRKTAELTRAQAELARLKAEEARLEAEEARSAILPPASFTKIGEPKKLYRAMTIAEWVEVDEWEASP